MGARREPASVGQRLLWFADHYRGADGALNCPVVCRLRGPLDVPALRSALEGLICRHESLRTTFSGRGRNLIQIIHDSGQLPFEEIDLCRNGGAEAAARQVVSEELRTRIDPGHCPVRVRLWRADRDDHVLCINVHHLVTDAWSCPVLFAELRLLFDRAIGNGAELPRAGWQYTQFIEWQQRLIESGEMARHAEYWCRQLADARVPDLPNSSEASRPAERRATRIAIDLSPAVAGALRQLARGERTTLFTVMLSVYYVLLHSLTGRTDLPVGTMFANRLLDEVQTTIGFLANMVVLRTQIAGAATFDQIIKRARTTVTDAFMHQSMPYHMLPANLIQGGLGRLNEVMFQMIAEPLSRVKMGRAEAEVLVPEDIGSRFDLELVLVPRAGGFRAVLFYDGRRFGREWAQRFVSGYASLAAAAARRPRAPLTELGAAVGG